MMMRLLLAPLFAAAMIALPAAAQTTTANQPCTPPQFSPGVRFPGVPEGCVTFSQYFGAIYRLAITLALTLAVIMTIVAGYIYATSGGEPARLTIAKDIFISVVIGLSVLVLAGLIIRNIVAT